MSRVPTPVPSPSDSHTISLEAEIRGLRDQVKALVRTESKLHKAQRRLDEQMTVFRKLYELGQLNNANFDLPAARILADRLSLPEARLFAELLVARNALGDAPPSEARMVTGGRFLLSMRY